MGNPVDRLSKWAILLAGMVVLVGLTGRLGRLLDVNRMALGQLRRQAPAAGDGQEFEWYLPAYTQGRGLALAGSVSRAIPLLEKANRLRPHHPPLLLELGVAHLKEGSFEAGLAYLRGVPGIGGRTEFGYLVHLGWNQVVANRDLPPDVQDWRLAERLFRAAVALSPEDRTPHTALIDLYVHSMKDRDKAQQAIRDAGVRVPGWNPRKIYAGRLPAAGEKSPPAADSAAHPNSPQRSPGKTKRPLPTGTKASRPLIVAAGPWVAPVLIYSTEGRILHPFLTADASGLLHCVWAEKKPRGPHRILYSSRSMDGWSPETVIHSGDWAAFVTASPAATDLVVSWSGPGNRLISRTLSRQGRAKGAWSGPRGIARGRGTGQLVWDASGKLHFAFPGRPMGVRYQFSTDGGQSWSGVGEIQGTKGKGVDFTSLAVDRKGRLHAVWTEFEAPKGWPPTGVFYAASVDGGQSWDAPLELAGAGYDQGAVVSAGDNTLHVVWNGKAGVGGRYHRLSVDAGRSWSETRRITRKGATNGPPRLALDRAARLHLITTSGEAVLYAAFEEGQWSEVVTVVGTDSRKLSWHEQVAMTIDPGDRLHIAYWASQERLYHQSLTPAAKSPRPRLNQGAAR